MNSVFGQLVRHELIQLLNSMQILQDKKWKTVLMSLLYGFVVLALAIYSAGSTYGLCLLGNSESVFPILISVISIIVLMTTVMKAGHQLYGARDLDLLMSFPISLRMILISKCFSSFLMNLIVSLAVLVPSGVVLGVLKGRWIHLGMSGLCAPFFVLIPMSAGILLSSFVFMIASRMKHGTWITVILLCALMFWLPALNEVMSSTSQMIELTEQISGSVRLNPLTCLMDEALSGRIGSVLALMLISLCCCAAVLEIITKSYLRVRSGVRSSVRREFTFSNQRSASVMKALIQREFRHYFSSSLYVSNTIIGLILGVALVISIYFVPLDDLILWMELPIQSEQLKLILPVMFAMVCGMCCTTASSLSLEGKSLWLIQSLPVSDSQIKAAKVLMNLILNVPVILLGSVLLGVRLNLSGLAMLANICLPLSICVFSAMTGMLANVWFQNYSWSSEVQVIKQGLPVLIGIFVPMIACVLLMGVMILCDHPWVPIIACLGVLSFSAVEWNLIQRKPIEG